MKHVKLSTWALGALALWAALLTASQLVFMGNVAEQYATVQAQINAMKSEIVVPVNPQSIPAPRTHANPKLHAHVHSHFVPWASLPPTTMSPPFYDTPPPEEDDPTLNFDGPCDRFGEGSHGNYLWECPYESFVI